MGWCLLTTPAGCMCNSGRFLGMHIRVVHEIVCVQFQSKDAFPQGLFTTYAVTVHPSACLTALTLGTGWLVVTNIASHGPYIAWRLHMRRLA